MAGSCGVNIQPHLREVPSSFKMICFLNSLAHEENVSMLGNKLLGRYTFNRGLQDTGVTLRRNISNIKE